MLSSRKIQIRRKESIGVRPDYKGCAGILEMHRGYIGDILRFGQVQVLMQPDAPHTTLFPRKTLLCAQRRGLKRRTSRIIQMTQATVGILQTVASLIYKWVLTHPHHHAEPESLRHQTNLSRKPQALHLHENS